MFGRSFQPRTLRGTSRPRPLPRDSSPQAWLAAVLVVYGAFIAVLTLTHPFSEFTFLVVSDVAGIVPPIAAGVAGLVAGQRSAYHVRTGWRLIGAGCLAWAAGETIWTVYEVGLGVEVPFPSLADVGYLAMLPLVALGLIVLSSERRRLVHSTPTLDGMALTLLLTAVVWFFVLHPTYTESAASVLEKAIGTAYPIGDLVLCYALAVAIQRQWGQRDAIVLTALLVGMLVLVAADVGFAYQTLHDTYTAQSLVNLGWPFGFLVIAYAAVLSASWTLTYATDDDAPVSRPWRQGLPAALLVPEVVLTISTFRSGALSTGVPLSVMVGLAALAVLLRLAINVGLVREIEGSRQRLVVWIEAERRRHAA